MNLRNRLEYSATASLLGLCRILPESTVYALFRGIAALMYRFSASRRKLTLHNINIAFPEKSNEEQRGIARRSFRNLSESMAFNALVMSGRISNERMLECVEAPGWEKLAAQSEAPGTGILMFSAHLGNWELLVQYCSFRSTVPLHAIARKSNNALLEERIVLPLRQRFGIHIIYKKNAIIKLVKALKRGEIVGLMVDQRLNLRQGILLPFFGTPAGTTTTPALLQIRFGCKVIPIFMVKIGHRKYRFIIEEPITWEDTGAPAEEQIAQLTMLHQQAVENVIRCYPDQWFWMHNRWGVNKDAL